MHNKHAHILLSIVAVNAIFCFAASRLAAAAEEGDSDHATVGQTVPSEPPAASGPVLLLGVFLEEKADKSLRNAVVNRLTRLGEEVRLAPETVDFIECKQTACYAEISAKLNVQRVFRVDVYESTPKRYYLEGVVYDQQTGNARSAKSSCEDCSGESLRTRLGDMAVRVVAGGEPAQVAPDPKPIIPPPAPPHPPVPAPRTRWTPERITLVTLLSTLTAATLVGTVLLPSIAPSKESSYCSLDTGIKPSEGNFRCVNIASWTIGGIVLSGLSTTSLALTLRQFSHKEADAN